MSYYRLKGTFVGFYLIEFQLEESIVVECIETNVFNSRSFLLSFHD